MHNPIPPNLHSNRAVGFNRTSCFPRLTTSSSSSSTSASPSIVISKTSKQLFAHAIASSTFPPSLLLAFPNFKSNAPPHLALDVESSSPHASNEIFLISSSSSTFPREHRNNVTCPILSSFPPLCTSSSSSPFLSLLCSYDPTATIEHKSSLLLFLLSLPFSS